MPLLACSQDIIGKWKGYFSPNNSSGVRVFTYDVSFAKTNTETLSITTLSKLNNEFSAKAYGNGTISGTMIQFYETRFDIIKLGSTSQGCLMTCYLNFKNIRGLDVLEGTYTSQSADGSKDCGGGTIYLQKNQSIEKTIADITPKKPISNQNKSNASITPLNTTSIKGINNTIAQKQAATIVAKTNNNLLENSKSSNKNNASKNSIVNNADHTIINSNVVTINAPTPADKIVTATNNTPILKQNNTTTITDPTPSSVTEDNIVDNIPWVLVGRENKLVKQINTTSKQFSIDLYDNGTIDNDTINVYDNKKLLANLKRLSDKPIHLEFNFTEKTKQHEVIITAHNMGLVPPNTALLVLKENGNRQELFITTTNTFNAKIIIQYNPPN
jgi:hypothetical protein